MIGTQPSGTTPLQVCKLTKTRHDGRNSYHRSVRRPLRDSDEHHGSSGYPAAKTSNADVSRGGTKHSRTNLIIQHGITDFVDQATESIRILIAVQELRGLASFCEWDEVLENIIQLSGNPNELD